MNESKLVRENLDSIAPNNSNKMKQKQESRKTDDKTKLQPIVTGKVTKEKKSIFKKFSEAFLGKSDNIGDFILYDVLIPAARATLSEIGIGIIEMLFGDRRRNNSLIRDRGRSYVNYNVISTDRLRRDDYRDISNRTRTSHDFDNIIFTTKHEAEDVLTHLVDLIEEYGEATVASFYELSGIETQFTDNNFGWTNLRDAYTDRVREGYIIRFPRTRAL